MNCIRARSPAVSEDWESYDSQHAGVLRRTADELL